MGSDFCSVPASSVDAEQAFSSGHLQISHLQHNMNSQTFRAQMAVGSWAQLPLYAGFDKMVGIVKSEMATWKQADWMEHGPKQCRSHHFGPT
ncbi:hypothetical protein L208DRAFT_1235889 [Tricholoma matsutake]|nr:hypothetical protein L208DRAFT_1235889 [Tricholoma matsutake 945]